MTMVTPIYAGLIGLLFVFLSLRVVIYRREFRISMGENGDKALQKRVRTQANCAEYAPFSLLLILMAELQSAPVWAAHGLGLALLIGRLMHAYGFGSHPQNIGLRVGGMVITFSVICAAAFTNIIYALM